MKPRTSTHRIGVILGALLIGIVLPLEARQDRGERPTGPTIQVPTRAAVNTVVRNTASTEGIVTKSEEPLPLFGPAHWGIDNQNGRVHQAAVRRRAELARRSQIRGELERISLVILPISPMLGATAEASPDGQAVTGDFADADFVDEDTFIVPPDEDATGVVIRDEARTGGNTGYVNPAAGSISGTNSAIAELLFISDWYSCFDGVAVDALPGTTAVNEGRSSFITDDGRYIPMAVRTHPLIQGWISAHAHARVNQTFGCVRPVASPADGMSSRPFVTDRDQSCAVVRIETFGDSRLDFAVELPSLGARNKTELDRAIGDLLDRGETVHLHPIGATEFQLAPGSLKDYSVLDCML